MHFSEGLSPAILRQGWEALSGYGKRQESASFQMRHSLCHLYALPSALASECSEATAWFVSIKEQFGSKPCVRHIQDIPPLMREPPSRVLRVSHFRLAGCCRYPRSQNRC